MPASNATLTILESSPYFDDFDQSKQYYRILHRPGKAVQTRELNVVQSILQNQIEKFALHVFKDGSQVLGGGLHLDTGVKSIKVLRSFGETPVNFTNVFNSTTNLGVILTGQTSGAKARVMQVENSTTDAFAVLIVNYLTDTTFAASETISGSGISLSVAAASDNPFDDASVMSIDEGTYFVNGLMAHVAPQTIILDANTNRPSGRVGLVISEVIVTENDDDDLLDNALNSTNYLAPGAHRLKVALTLAVKPLTGITPESRAADENFIELVRIVDGDIQKTVAIPDYNELEKTLARRTYDESGDYTVRPFPLQVRDHQNGNTALFSAGLDAGKAYIRGFEFQTISTEFLDVKRGRDTESVNNFDIGVGFGNYLVCNGIAGFLNIQNQTRVDLHSVPKASVVYTNNTTYNATKIATARVRSMEYVTTDTYNVYLTDLRGASINVVAASSNTTTITLGTDAAAVTDAYVGAKLTITAGPGTGQTFIISAYSSGRVATVTPTTWLGTFTANSSTQVRLDFTPAHVESFAAGTLGVPPTSSANGNISLVGRVGQTANGDAILWETDQNSLLFPLPQGWIKAGSLSDTDYEIIRPFTGVSFTGNATETTLTLTTSNGNERFYPSFGALSTADILENYILVRASNGQILNVNSSHIMSATIATVGTGVPGQITFTANGTNIPNGNAVSVLARINIDSATAKQKTLVSGNTTTTNGTSNASLGQVVVASPNTTPGVAISLGLPDVNRLVKVYQTANTTTTPNTTYMASQYDITDRFVLDNGQRDNLYDHASISLRTGATPPSGQLLVIVDWFQHSGGRGFFSVDSYVNVAYESIPSYTSPTSGRVFSLRDVLDFRPTRQANTSESLSATDYTVENGQLPHPDSTFEADFQYYLGRTDKLVLTRDREFKVVEGVSSLNPVAPPDDPDSMTLYMLKVQPYTANVQTDVKVEYVENRRYTMRDIGRLERRIENLEYYTTLNLLEKQARDSVLLDTDQLERFKNGILVDPFAGHNIGDVQDSDYRCSIDTRGRELRAPFTSEALTYSLATANSIGIVRTGDLVTLNYGTTALVEQPLASKAVNINPFNVTNFLGSMKLFPASDVWVDTVTRPDVHINFAGQNDNWETIGFGTQWSDWTTRWAGEQVVGNQTLARPGIAPDGIRRVEVIERTTVESSQLESRSGVSTSLVPEMITRSLGNRVVDISVTPFMRTQNVWFTVSGLKPGANVTPQFDGTDISNYVERANELTLSGNVAFRDSEGVWERLTSNATSAGTGRVIAVRGNTVKLVEAQGEYLFANGSPSLVTGNVSALSGVVTAYTHWSGPFAAANATTATLNVGASANNDYYNGLTLRVVRGPGAGTSTTITDYDGTTKVATISGWSGTVPTTASRYSIGNLNADGLTNATSGIVAGDLAGVFYLPNSDTVRFRAGERLFRITDNVITSFATTSADQIYRAQGTTQTVEATTISTRQWNVMRTSVTEDRVITNRTTQDVVDWVDPLAQTILVDAKLYPAGVFISSVDVYFKTKDTQGIPVTLQIRPTINGYPSSGLVVPFGEVTLSPAQVKTSELPSTANSATKTTFSFPSLVYLSPGQEYAITLLSNSLEYSVYVAEIGGQQLDSTRKISTQPYAGSLFKSQNSSTWTAVQEEDLMFVVHRADFDTTTQGIAEFVATNPSSNVNTDIVFVEGGHLDFAGTVTAWAYKPTDVTGAYRDYYHLQIDQNTELSQRAKVLSTGNTFAVRATMMTSDPAISPVVDLQRLYSVMVQNKIDNGELTVNNFTIVSGGTGYGASTNVALTITGSTGSGAAAVATTNASGVITGITLTAPGSGYTGDVTVTVGGSGSGASVVYVGEGNPNGGSANAKYITRRVTLADGFEASDLIVQFNAYKPAGTEVDVYYKVLASDDSGTFDSKNWTKMRQTTSSQIVSTPGSGDFKEFTFATQANNASYTSGTTTYTRFKTFAIKVVMRSSTTTVVPRVRDLRVIALDE
jgi:hypothetical protein